MPRTSLRKISKEEIVDFPMGKYEGEINVIRNSKLAAKALAEIKKCPILGMDTESRPAFRRGQSFPVALMQLATDKKVYLFRLLETGPLPELAEILGNEEITKVGIAPRNDMKDLAKTLHFTPQNIIDLNKFAEEKGYQSIGARKLTAMVLGIRISKAQQVSNWENRNLTRAQIEYAATDAWICREIYLKLAKLK